MGGYYNTTETSPEMSNPMLAYSWYPVEGTFPLVLELGVSQERMKRLWAAVREGEYLDEQAKVRLPAMGGGGGGEQEGEGKGEGKEWREQLDVQERQGMGAKSGLRSRAWSKRRKIDTGLA